MQRWTATSKCPVCGGFPGGRPHCWGFLGGDGCYAHCTREEHAGGLERHDGSNAFVHFLGVGESGCNCGETHHGTESARGTKPPRDEASARRQIEEILNGCERPPTGVIRYLQGRGLRPKKISANALRYHPALPYFDEDGDHRGDFPAVVAVVRGNDGETVALRRTYLAPDGQSKLRAINGQPVQPKKNTATIREGALAGAAIRLARIEDVGDVLGVAEGVETALAVTEAIGVPVWAAGDANGLRHITLPQKVRHVEVWADNDESGTGQKAATALAERLVAEGRAVRIVIPERAGEDWLNVLTTSPPPREAPLMRARREAKPFTATEAKSEEPSRRHRRFLNDAESLALPNVEFLLGHVLPLRNIAFLVGASGNGKTFVLVDLAFSVKTGEPWLGRPVKQGPVVYVEGEGDPEFKYRLLAWKREHGFEDEACGVEFLYEPVDLMDKKSVDELIDDIRALPQPPVLIILETLACCLGEGDENSATDMRVAVGSLKRLRREFGCTVLASHHVGHAAPERARGSKALHDAADTILMLTKEDDVLRLSCGKRRGVPFEEIVARLEPRTVAGQESAILTPADGSTVAAGDKLTVNQLKALRILVEVYGDEGVRHGRWCKATGLADTTFDRVLAGLLGGGYCEKQGEGRRTVYLATARGRAALPPSPPHHPHGGNGGEPKSPPSPPHSFRSGGVGVRPGESAEGFDPADPEVCEGWPDDVKGGATLH